jgi:hypothetical protein
MAVAAALGLSFVAAQTARRSPPVSSWTGIQRTPRGTAWAAMPGTSQTWIEGTFTGPFTHSPVGKLEPNGARVVWDLMNMFRFDDRGRLVEEIVRTDNRSFLRQLGAGAA